MAGGVIAVAVTFGVLIQTAKALQIGPMGQSWQYTPLFEFVRAQTSPEEVLLLADSNEPLPSWLVAQTGRRVYVCRHMAFIPARDKVDYRRRAICLYWLRGTPEEEFRAAAEAPWSLLYTPEGSVYGFHPHLLTEEIQASVAAEYQAAQATPLNYCREEFRVDALLESGRWRFDASRVEQIFEVTSSAANGDLRLLRVRRKAE
jgi:hypothetical protein